MQALLPIQLNWTDRHHLNLSYDYLEVFVASFFISPKTDIPK